MVCWQRATKVRSPGILKPDVSRLAACFSEFVGNIDEAYTRCWLHELWQHSLGPSGGLSVYDHGRPWGCQDAWVSLFRVAGVEEMPKMEVWKKTTHWFMTYKTCCSKSSLSIRIKWLDLVDPLDLALCCQAGPISCTECRIAMTSLPGSQNDEGPARDRPGHFAFIQEDRQYTSRAGHLGFP